MYAVSCFSCFALGFVVVALFSFWFFFSPICFLKTKRKKGCRVQLGGWGAGTGRRNKDENILNEIKKKGMVTEGTWAFRNCCDWSKSRGGRVRMSLALNDNISTGRKELTLENVEVVRL